MASEPALRRVTARDPDAVDVVACGLSRFQRAYALDGLRRAHCRFVDTFDELQRRLPALGPCDVFLLASHDEHGRDALTTVRRVASEWPAAAIVVFCRSRPDRVPSLHTLALAGAQQFVFEGVSDTAAALAVAADSARRERVAASVAARLLPLVPASLHTTVDMILARPDEVTTVEALARAMGVHRKTLVNRCARAAFPPPAALLTWCRLALVAHALEHTGSTVESIALRLGYPSHTALRNLIKRYTGRRATEIRAEGGLDAVLEALRRRLGRCAAALPIM